MAKKSHDRLKISGLVELPMQALLDTNGGRGRSGELGPTPGTAPLSWWSYLTRLWR
jgi:hypothetical protein